MFAVLVPLPHLQFSDPLCTWHLPMERASHRVPWDYDLRDIALHPERWEGRSAEDRTLGPSWNPAPGPMR